MVWSKTNLKQKSAGRLGYISNEVYSDQQPHWPSSLNSSGGSKIVLMNNADGGQNSIWMIICRILSLNMFTVT